MEDQKVSSQFWQKKKAQMLIFKEEMQAVLNLKEEDGRSENYKSIQN